MEYINMLFWGFFFIAFTIRYGVLTYTAAQHLKEGRSSILLLTHWWFLRESDFDEEGKAICKKTGRLVFQALAVLVLWTALSYGLNIFIDS
jgi:hypothetical protein